MTVSVVADSCSPAVLRRVALLRACRPAQSEHTDVGSYRRAAGGCSTTTASTRWTPASYKAAASYFDEVERQHPYSEWARQRAADGGLRLLPGDNKYDEAIAALDRFIQLHPGNRDVAYAYYLRALCYYEQIADVGRDQDDDASRRWTRCTRWCSRFPDTAYARDAAAEDRPGPRPSGRQGDGDRPLVPAPAAIRSRPSAASSSVVDDYQTTSHVPEALHRLTEAIWRSAWPTRRRSAGRGAGLQLSGQRLVPGQLRPAGRRAEPAAAAQTKRRLLGSDLASF